MDKSKGMYITCMQTQSLTILQHRKHWIGNRHIPHKAQFIWCLIIRDSGQVDNHDGQSYNSYRNKSRLTVEAKTMPVMAVSQSLFTFTDDLLLRLWSSKRAWYQIMRGHFPM